MQAYVTTLITVDDWKVQNPEIFIVNAKHKLVFFPVYNEFSACGDKRLFEFQKQLQTNLSFHSKHSEIRTLLLQ